MDPTRGRSVVWATLPDYIDTTDLLAKALREEVAFVPGRAAFPMAAEAAIGFAELVERILSPARERPATEATLPA